MSRYHDDDYRRSEPRQSSRREPRDRDRERDRPETTSTRRDRTIPEHSDRDMRMTDATMLDSRMDTRMDTRMDARMDSRIDPRMDPRLDPRMDIRTDPRANAAARIDPPRMDRSSDADGALVRDPVTGELYREVRTVPARSPFARDDRDDHAPSRPRTTMDAPMGRPEPIRPEYSEYFCPGDGIEREVIQHEICKFLGQDATCRPGRNEQGQAGYWVRAYRPFTSAMERSLREATVAWQRERRSRASQGRSTGSYADMSARQESQRGYGREMDLDDDDYSRSLARHPRDDPRAIPGSRVLPVSTGYPPEPGYSAQYTISSSQPGYAPGQSDYYAPGREPRTAYGPGNTTPPSISRSTQPGYTTSGYPSRTGPPVTSSSIPTSYDSRRDIMGGYPTQGYSEPPRSGRHR